ncbi:MAG TPA: hypothetical protein P5513_00235 [Candidatus Diapherotrites archaeon]|mgnify:CR=1 FL=1|nr:hypothetical protein [Candidatus Diapherotrites archaeon]
MKYKYKNIYFVFFIFLFLFNFNFLFASSIDSINVSNVQVKSDTYTSFENVNYANYNENIDVKINVDVSGDIGESIPIYATLYIIGILPNGTKEVSLVSPTNLFYVSSNSTFEYDYDNLFVFKTKYVGYEIKLDISYNNNTLTDSGSAYVYLIGQSSFPSDVDDVPNNTLPPHNCSGFYVSGPSTIYLDEDDDASYSFSIINLSNTNLIIDSIDVSDADELDIDDISFPDIVSANSTGHAHLDLFADTVSSDDSGSFEINVIGVSNGVSCTDVFSVNYHIDNQEHENSASCSDISYDNVSFSIDEDDSKFVYLNITNESLDYVYEIEEIEIDDGEYVFASVSNPPSIIDEDSTEKIKLNLSSDFVSSDTIEHLDLYVRGHFTRPGYEDKTCNKHIDVSIKVLNSSSIHISSPSSSNSQTPSNSTSSPNSQLVPDMCDFTLTVPESLIIDESQEEIMLFFSKHNSLEGTIKIIADGALVSPSVIYLDDVNSFSKKIVLNNFLSPKKVIYVVSINGCLPQTYYTSLINNLLLSKDILVSLSPRFIADTSTKLIAVELTNSSSESKEIKVKLSGFPNTWKIISSPNPISQEALSTITSTDRLVVPPHETKLFYFFVSFSEPFTNASYNGYLEVYSGNDLISKTPLTIDQINENSIVSLTKTVQKIDNEKNSFYVYVTLKNNSSGIKNLFIDFNFSEDYVIDGNREVILQPQESKLVIYKIVAPADVVNNFCALMSVKDSITYSILVQDIICFEIINRGSPTAFFNLHSASGILSVVVLIIIVLFIIGLIIRNNRKKEKGINYSFSKK